MAPYAVWFTEVAHRQWIVAPLVPGRPIRLPLGTRPIAAGSGLIVTATISKSETAVGVWDVRNGNRLAEVVLPLDVSSAVSRMPA